MAPALYPANFFSSERPLRQMPVPDVAAPGRGTEKGVATPAPMRRSSVRPFVRSAYAGRRNANRVAK